MVDYTGITVGLDRFYNHDPHSAIVDGTQARVSGAHPGKTLVWCDNEWALLTGCRHHVSDGLPDWFSGSTRQRRQNLSIVREFTMSQPVR